jgi:hypothetical protein
MYMHFVEMTDDDTPPSKIATGDELAIEWADNSRESAQVLNSDGATFVELKATSGSYRLRPHTAKDYPVSMESPGLHFQNWVIE